MGIQRGAHEAEAVLFFGIPYIFEGRTTSAGTIMKRVGNKIVIVTGAALGIGEAASLLLAQEGAKVAVTDSNDEQGGLAERITAASGVTEFWRPDVTRESGFRAHAVRTVRYRSRRQ